MSDEQRTVELALGALCKPISEQLEAQGLPFDAETVRHLQLDAEAASRLRVRGALTHAEGDRAYGRICKRIWAEVARASKPA